MTCISTCSRPAILRCPSVAYFVPVSFLRDASFGRTIAARAIRSRFFEASLRASAEELFHGTVSVGKVDEESGDLLPVLFRAKLRERWMVVHGEFQRMGHLHQGGGERAG